MNIKSYIQNLLLSGTFKAYDATGSVLFDNTLKIADSKNIKTQVYGDSFTSHSYSTGAGATGTSGELLSGSFYLAEGEQYVYLVCNAWMNSDSDIHEARGAVQFGIVAQSQEYVYNPTGSFAVSWPAVSSYTTGTTFTSGQHIDPSCFPAGTLISLPDNKTIKIEDMEPDTIVKSYDTNTNTFSESIVKKCIKLSESYLYDINRKILVTPFHKFYTARGWIEAQNLYVGDLLKDINNEWISITDIVLMQLDKKIDVYTFNMADNTQPNYYANNILVHNKQAQIDSLVLLPCIIKINAATANTYYKWSIKLTVTSNGGTAVATPRISDIKIFTSRYVGAMDQIESQFVGNLTS